EALAEEDHAHDEGEEEHEEDLAEDEASPSNGRLASSASRANGASAGASYILPSGFIGAAVSTFRTRYGVPGHSHAEHGHSDEEHAHESEDLHGEETLSGVDSDELVLEHDDEPISEADGVAIDLEQVRLDLRGEVRDVSGSIEKVRFRGGVSNYDHRELEGVEIGTTFEKNAGEGRVELVQREIDGLRGVVGMQFEGFDFQARGEEAFIPAHRSYSPAMFAFEQLKLDPHWTVQAGGRAEYVRLDPDGFAVQEFAPFAASSGVVYDFGGVAAHTLGLSLSYAERAPTATELFADGVHTARQIFERGRGDLEAESSWGADLTFKRNVGLVTGAVNLFYQQYADYINLSGTEEETDGVRVFEYDDVQARFWGSEVEAVLHLHQLLNTYEHDLDLAGQVDFVEARNITDDQDLPRIPPLRSRVRLTHQWMRAVTSQLEAVFVEPQDDVAAFELPTDAYQLLNASVGYTLGVETQQTITIYAQGYNLTDEEARVHTSFLKDIAPLSGRSFIVGVRATF
ncbi:MAG: TonB-dependent receptor, partial [Deltaproteobacteria bacterium]|nr:TonB-dependent receptor [Deltaproteobacteria bacterium]